MALSEGQPRQQHEHAHARPWTAWRMVADDMWERLAAAPARPKAWNRLSHSADVYLGPGIPTGRTLLTKDD
jgi:hypothetical protein